MFKEAAPNGHLTSLEEFAASVTGYISEWIDDTTIYYHHRTSQKPLMNTVVYEQLKTHDDMATLRNTWNIKEDTDDHINIIKVIWGVWQSVQVITDF